MATKIGVIASKLLVEMADKASFEVSCGNKRYGYMASPETESERLAT